MPDRKRRAELLNRQWVYADGVPEQVAEVARRIARVARRGQLIHYSDLVSGIEFRLQNVENGQPFELGVPEWRDLDRAILGEVLGKISFDAYAKHGILPSALVTSKVSETPSEGFWALVEELGLKHGRSEDGRTMFWSDEVKKACEWYTTHKTP